MLIPFGVFSAAGAGGGAAAGAYELISSTVLSSTASSVTFSSIDTTTYKHLQVRAVVAGAAGSSNVFARLNGVTSNLYDQHFLYGDGTSVASFAQTTRTSMYLWSMPDNASYTNEFAPLVLDLLDAGSTTKNKTARHLMGQVTTANNKDITLGSNLLRSTSAVTSMEIYTTGNFRIGSRFSLYGIKG